jgi:hypothetical protein
MGNDFIPLGYNSDSPLYPYVGLITLGFLIISFAAYLFLIRYIGKKVPLPWYKIVVEVVAVLSFIGMEYIYIDILGKDFLERIFWFLVPLAGISVMTGMETNKKLEREKRDKNDPAAAQLFIMVPVCILLTYFMLGQVIIGASQFTYLMGNDILYRNIWYVVGGMVALYALLALVSWGRLIKLTLQGLAHVGLIILLIVFQIGIQLVREVNARSVTYMIDEPAASAAAGGEVQFVAYDTGEPMNISFERPSFWQPINGDGSVADNRLRSFQVPVPPDKQEEGVIEDIFQVYCTNEKIEEYTDRLVKLDDLVSRRSITAGGQSATEVVTKIKDEFWSNDSKSGRESAYVIFSQRGQTCSLKISRSENELNRKNFNRLVESIKLQ